MVPGNWGDINIVDEIRLQGKDYLVILNADAMGKSIQEAGGAIVMGALFRSIIERTKMASHVSLNSPERWLKNTWSEIQKVFESFDGSMLVSAVIALLDLEKGILYSLNAEYPPIVLLRDGVASYLHNNFTSRKFGTLGIFPKIEIKVDCLQVEDILIFGSDGRDDLLVTTPTGEKRINEDENLFLRIVEEADGSLDRIVLGLSEKGEITDDLSLILIEYLGSEEKNLKKEIPIELTRKDGDYLEISKQMIYSHIKNKNYQEALRLSKILVEEYPAENDLLYLLSYAAKLAREFDLAIEFGERLRLRDAFLVKNLINLADVYYQRQDPLRAQELLGEVEKLEGDNPLLLRFREKLQSSKDGLSVS